MELNSKNFDELLNLSKQYPLLSETKKNILEKMFSIATKERSTKKLITIINNGSSHFPVLREKINTRLFKLNPTIADRLTVYLKISDKWNDHKQDAAAAILDLLTTPDECQSIYHELVKSFTGTPDISTIYDKYADFNVYDQELLLKTLAKTLIFDQTALGYCDFVRQESIHFFTVIQALKQQFLDSEPQNSIFYQRNPEQQQFFDRLNLLLNNFVELENKSLLKKIELSVDFVDYLRVFTHTLSFKARHPVYSQILIETIFTKIFQIPNLDFDQCEFVWRESDPGSQWEKEALRQQLENHLAVTLEQKQILWTKLKSGSDEEHLLEAQMFDTFPNQKSDIILFFKAHMTQNFKFTTPLSKALIP